MTFKNILIIVTFVVLALAFLFYIISSNKDEPGVFSDISPETSSTVGVSLVDEPESELIQQPVEVGEIEGETTKDGEIIAKVDLPVNIFSTTGLILDIGQDFLIIQGDGGNFADTKSRQLKSLVEKGIILFDKNKVKHEGLDALDLLKIGDQVLVSSQDNIRGKTEFIIKNISVLN